MQLRTKLFLWIGGVFLIAFLLSFAIEDRLTDRFINDVKTGWKNYVLKTNEVKRKSIQEFIGISIAESIARIDATLRAIVLKGPEYFSFSNTLLNDSALSFLQYGNQCYSRPKEVTLAQIVPIDQTLSWIFYKKRGSILAWEGPACAIKTSNAVKDRRGDLFVLFDPLSSSLPEELKTAAKKFQETPKPSPDSSSQENDIRNLCLSTPNEPVRDDIQRFFLHSDQNYLGGFLLKYSSWEGVTGTALVAQNEQIGDLVFKTEAFTNTQVFDDEAYFKEHHSLPPCLPIGNYLALISTRDGKRCFFGNTAQVGDGLLTIGVDPDEILRLLSLSSEKASLLMAGGKILSGIDPRGEILPSLDLFQNASFFSKDTGLFDTGGISWFFMKMSPVPNLDLHFILLVPANQEFSLINTITKEAKAVISRMSHQMHLVLVIGICFALFGLHRTASRITKPVDQLVIATQEVGKGRLEGFDLPLRPNSRDEIDILCVSFAKMVQDLRDKEKVRDVLNKVVSEEIAQEILKGNIHLGGEEKAVTVLFADIRSFTHLTEKMQPGEVIDLLNTCMTRVSNVIDQYGGVIDKYIGDAVMALFGAPLAQENAPFHAIECALKMKGVLEEWNRERAMKGLGTIEMGFGIHTGSVIVGNMGAQNRLNYTAIGAAVNLAARLCSAAHPGQILVTKATVGTVLDRVIIQPLEPMILKGFSQPIEVFEVKGIKNAV